MESSIAVTWEELTDEIILLQREDIVKSISIL